MSIYVLTWIREDLIKNGDDLSNYKLLDLKEIIEKYKEIYLIR